MEGYNNQRLQKTYFNETTNKKMFVKESYTGENTGCFSDRLPLLGAQKNKKFVQFINMGKYLTAD